MQCKICGRTTSKSNGMFLKEKDGFVCFDCLDENH